MRTRNVFILGADPFNVEILKRGPNSEWVDYHPLLDYDRVQREHRYPVEELLEEARGVLNAFDGPVDGIVAWWDFPVTLMAAVLCAEYGLPAPSLEATLRCEHKYWSRLVQREVLPEHTPAFCAVDPTDPEAAERVDIGFPLWIKPIKAHSSQLGFRIDDRAELRRAVTAIREGIGSWAGPFDRFLSRVEPPPEVSGIGGGWAIAEAIIGGHQVTVEGYALQGEIAITSVIDSIRYDELSQGPRVSSFARYQYPSRLPTRIVRRLTAVVRRLMTALGYEGGTFNVELYWDEANDRIWILEVNPRYSQSHASITEYVDGVPNLDRMVDIALGRRPRTRKVAGPYAVAAKVFLRHFRDARVRRLPTPRAIAELREQLPSVRVELVAEEGRRLSSLAHQDSYSYELARLHLGAHDREELEEVIARCRRRLQFALDEPQEHVSGVRA